jgi:hypothetical protein
LKNKEVLPHVKLHQKTLRTFLGQIELFEMYPKIYALVIKDDKLRARGIHEIPRVL